MPSAAITRPISVTVAFIACCIRRASFRVLVAAILRIVAGKIAEHQPPFRPDAPKPITSASRTAMRNEGSARAR